MTEDILRDFPHRLFSSLQDYGPREYFVTVTLVAALVWETLFQWFRTVIVPTYAPPFILLSDDPDGKKKSDRLSMLLQQAPSYLCSIVHSLITGGSALHFYLQLHAITDDVAAQYTTLPPGMIEVDALFLGYLLYDLIHLLYQYPRLGGLDLVLHHVVFMICAWYNGLYSMHTFTFSWLLLGEWSTVCLSLRWLYIQGGRGATMGFQRIQHAFCALFFLTRIVLYNVGLWHMVRHWKEMMDGILRICRPPKAILYTTTLLVFAGGVLNGVWMYKIFLLAARPTRKRSSDTKKPQ